MASASSVLLATDSDPLNLNYCLYCQVYSGVAPGIFRRGGLNLPMRGLKCGFQGTIKCYKSPKKSLSPSDGG